jgi:hypothetical protein
VPVVVVVFDEFPATSLIGAHGTIDRVRYPNFAALAGDATWFPHATTVADATSAAVPAILDGRQHRPIPERRARPPRRNLLTLLSHRGWRVRAHEDGRVCQRRFCGPPRSPRYYLVRRRAGRFGDFVGRIKPGRRRTLYYAHFLLPHVPWTYLPSGRSYLHGVFPAIKGINSQRGVHDGGLVNLSWERHLLQVMAVDHLVGGLVARLRATGLYDRALIVVTADHGISFRRGQLDRRTVTHRNVDDVAPVPLFVKRPGQHRGRISGAFARTTDVLPTIARVLHVRVPWRTAGRSAFSRAVRHRHTVRVSGRAGNEPVVKLSRGRFLRRWRHRIRIQHGIFGLGPGGLYRLGAHRGLVGHQLVSSGGRLTLAGRPVGLSRARALIFSAGDIHNVNLTSGFVPALLTGTIHHGRRGARRNLVFVVNGRVAAVGRSFYLRGSRRESFAAMVSESSFRPGRNSVQVLSVSGRRRHLGFRLLGGV